MKRIHILFGLLLFLFLLLVNSSLLAAAENPDTTFQFKRSRPQKIKEKTSPQSIAKTAQGDHGVQITSTGIEKSSIAWALDSGLIAFGQYDLDNSDIWLVSVNGSSMYNLTASIPEDCDEPFFMSNDLEIAFTFYRYEDDSWSIQYINLAIDNLTGDSIITAPEPLVDDALAGCISRDDRYIAYRIATTSELAVYDREKESITVIAEGDWFYGRSCFTHDGMHIITAMDPEWDEVGKLYKIPRNGGEPVQLTFGEGDHDFPKISPDGRWVIYTDMSNGTLYLLNLETGISELLFPEMETWQWNWMGDFSPDVSRVAHLLDVEGSNEVFIAEFPYAPPKFVELLSLNGGETLDPGTSHEIKWDASGIANVRLEYSLNDGANWNLIAASIPAIEGSYSWKIPNMPSRQCRIRISAPAGINVAVDISESNFEITAIPVELFVELISPADGEELEAGSTYSIEWNSNGISYVDIYFDSEDIVEYMIEDNVPASDGYYEWEIPDYFVFNECYIWIGDTLEQVEDYNEEPFKITASSGEPYIDILAPDGGERWEVGTLQNITWESELVSSVIISYSTDGGENWIIIELNYTPVTTAETAAQYTYSWTVPNTVSSNCLVGLLDAQNFDVGDFSDNPFEIIPADQEVEQVFQYDTYGEINFSSPAIGDDGTIYIGSVDTYLHAVNPNGINKWLFETNNAISSSPAIGNDGTIYFGSFDWYLYAVRPNSSIQWTLLTDGPIFSSPAIGNDGTLYFGTYNGSFYAVTQDKTIKWKKTLDAAIFSSPAVGSDGTIYFGDEDGNLYAFTANGSLKWKKYAGGSIYSSPAIGPDETIYIGTGDDGSVCAFNPAGSLKWKKQLGEYVESSAAIGEDGTIYVGVEGPGDLVALDPEEGSIRWNYSTGGSIVSSPAVGNDGTIYIGSDDWNVYAIGPDGSLKWSFPTGDQVQSSPVLGNNGILYVGSKDYSLYALDTKTGAGLADSSWPKYRHDVYNTGRKIVSETKPYIRVTSPDGGENLLPGSSFDITWTSLNVSTVRILYSTDLGVNRSLIVGETQASVGSYPWHIPDGINSEECLIFIVNTTDNTIWDRSNAVFSISEQPFIEVTSPAGGERWPVGTSRVVTWNFQSVDHVNIQFSEDGGANWSTVESNIDASSGSYTWIIPDAISSNCKIRIVDAANTDVAGEDAGIFSIISDIFIEVTAPKFGDRWSVGTAKLIRWEYNRVTNVKIEYSTDNGTTWATIAASTSASDTNYPWTVPDKQSDQCIIRISDATSAGVFDRSDVFEIVLPELTITPEIIEESQQLEEITFNTTVTSTAAIDSVVLHYDVTGRRVFDTSVVMQPAGGDNFTVTLDQSKFSALGLEYYITSRDTENKKNRAPAEGFYSIKAIVPGGSVMSHQIPGGSAEKAYQMVSIPLNLNQTSIINQLEQLPTGESEIDFQLCRYVGSTENNGYEIYPDIAEGFEPGRAFWLLAVNGFRLEPTDGTTVSTLETEPFYLTIKPGWNDIANPWQFDINWSDISVNPSDKENLSVLFSYNTQWSDPLSPPDVLESWKGYSINNSSNITIKVRLNPPSPTRSTDKIAGALKQNETEIIDKTEVTDNEIGWMIRIQAFAGEASDSANYFGVRTGAKDTWDIFDHVEPLPIGDYVYLTFPHADWEKKPSSYTVDFRPPSSELLKWDFDVTTNISGKPVTVELDEVRELPESAGYLLKDRDSGAIIPVLDGSFSFTSGNGITERHFTVEIGNASSQEQELALSRPANFLVARCYPNPFNPATTIEYEVARAGNVVISVFNTIGQRVGRYDQGMVDPGTHAFVFTAEGLTSGLYFYRIDTRFVSVTGKMLFMK